MTQLRICTSVGLFSYIYAVFVGYLYILAYAITLYCHQQRASHQYMIHVSY